MTGSSKAAVSSNTDMGLGRGEGVCGLCLCVKLYVCMLWHAPVQTTGVWWGNSISSATQSAWRPSISQSSAIDLSCRRPGRGRLLVNTAQLTNQVPGWPVHKDEKLSDVKTESQIICVSVDVHRLRRGQRMYDFPRLSITVIINPSLPLTQSRADMNL